MEQDSFLNSFDESNDFVEVKNAFKQKPKTANINLQEEWKNRWKWKTTIRNYQFRNFDRSDSRLMKF